MADASNQSTTQHLLPNLDPTVVAGYSAQKAILVELLSSTDVGAYEILNDTVSLLSVAAMHPFSRGSVQFSQRILTCSPSRIPATAPIHLTVKYL